ncbi:MAG: DUF4012 domain-containing protein [bacterium]|nr:DUF4012 domain-containing protein [bacterium]
MKKSTKTRIKKIVIFSVLTVTVSVGAFIYMVMGPLRSFFWNLPYLAGFLGPRNYLVLIQNDNELRPTGGFITAVGKVSTLFGVTSLEVSDSYQIPDPSPRLPEPEPFHYFIGQNDPFFAGWTLRDANFSPDFAHSSRNVLDLYRRAYPNQSIDAVFAIDFSAFERLLELYGPMEIEGTQFDQNNFFLLSQRLSKDVDTHNVNQLNSRKDVMKPLASELLNSMIWSPLRYRKLFHTLHQLGQEKHLLAYSASESFQGKLEQFGLTNSIRQEDSASDFLHVNVANIGGRKADRYVTKDVKYRADFSNPQQHRSVLELSLEHLGNYNIQSDIYQAYVRSYVPLGSRLLSSSGTSLRSTEVGADLDLTTFADYVRLKPGDTLTLSYEYQLPDSVMATDYRLRVVKQPGIQNQNWQVAVKQANDSTMIESSDSEPMTIREELALWRGIPATDLDFHLLLQNDGLAPIILWQKFESLTTINVRFQENLDIQTATNASHFAIRDMDQKNALQDTIVVQSARFSERDLWLTVSGVTDLPEEHYELEIRDIRDQSGNLIDPNPLLRTLVQRLHE